MVWGLGFRVFATGLRAWALKLGVLNSKPEAAYIMRCFDVSCTIRT